MSARGPGVSGVVFRAAGLAKRWPGGQGLAPIDLELTVGEVVALRGRSGSGKSTLLAILAGWCPPSAGMIERAPASGPERWRGTSIVPQTFGLMPELTVHENVELPVRLARRSTTAAVHELLAELDLGDLATRLPGELSLGQQQRTAIARAVVIQPALLLVDEPTSHQDRRHAEAVMSRLRAAAREEGASVLFASHDPLAIGVADRVMDLDPP